MDMKNCSVVAPSVELQRNVMWRWDCLKRYHPSGLDPWDPMESTSLQPLVSDLQRTKIMSTNIADKMC